MSPRLRLRGAALLLAVPLGSACSREPQTPVGRLLAGIENAAEERDAPAVAAHLTGDFRGQGTLDRAAVETELRRYFALYEGVAVEYADLAAEDTGGQARVTVRVLFSGKPKFEGRFGLVAADSRPFRFTLVCREENGKLLVAEAAWEEETPGSPPAAR